MNNENEPNANVIPTEERKITFFIDQYQRLFASVPFGNRGIVNYPLHSESFKRIAAQEVMKQLDSKGNPKRPTPENIKTYIAECEAEAYKSGQTFDIYNRAARFGNSYYIDCCDDQGKVVMFNKEGWILLDMQLYPMFMRYSDMQPITIANKGSREAFDKFISLLHVSENYKIQIESYVVLTGLPDIQQVILYMIGPQGSVKSTAEELIGSVFDPTITESLTMPTQQRDIVQQLMHHYVPVYDNVDNISDNIASDLCRACTGGGFEKRKLYSDDDDIIYRYRRKIMLNGINVGNQRPDFIDRCLIILQERVPDEQRRAKEDIKEEAKKLLPEVRAYCLDTLVKAINLYDNVKQELQGKLPRMADYCIWAESVSRALGYEPMTFYNNFMALQDKQTRDALLSDTVGELTIEWLDQNEGWKTNKLVEIAASDFYNEIRKLAEERHYNLRQIRFPGNAKWMTDRLNSLKHSFSEYGINVDTSIRGRNNNKYIFTDCSTTSTAPQ